MGLWLGNKLPGALFCSGGFKIILDENSTLLICSIKCYFVNPHCGICS